MNYKKPRLVMALGSRGGYLAFKQVMEELYRDILKKGAVYLVEHRHRPENEGLVLDFESMGMELNAHEVRDGMLLENGFFFCPGIVHERDKVPSTAIKEDEKSGLVCFHYFETHPQFYRMFTFQIEKALQAGYGEDLLIAFLSGHGDDGCDVLEKSRKGGSKLIIQDPDTAAVGTMPKTVITMANLSGMEEGKDYEVLPPGEIGYRINDFFSR